MSKDLNRTIGKIYIQAQVCNETNLLIASGNDENFDFEVVRDADNNPYIPASSFAGMLRSHLEDHIDFSQSNSHQSAYDYLFGSKSTGDSDANSSLQSHMIISELYAIKDHTMTSFRDGVCIDYATGAAKKGEKYDYEFIQPGQLFQLTIEVTIREHCSDHLEAILSIITYIAEAGKNSDLYQGAFTTHKFGQLTFQNINIKYFDFAKEGMAHIWYKFLQQNAPAETSAQDLDISNKKFEEEYLHIKRVAKFKAEFEIVNRLIIGASELSKSTDGKKEPTRSSLTNTEGHYIISAKSVRGAIRHRCHKILNTIIKSDPDAFIHHLFGWVDNTKNEGTPIKGRIKFKDTSIAHNNKYSQTRIKVCRLTGKTIEGALLNEDLVERGIFSLDLEINNYSEKEIALVMMALKDMANQDLAIGANKTIGRGYVKGLTLQIQYNNQEVLRWDGEKFYLDASKTIEKCLTENQFA
jgi:CRISPR/Cas system CSM-associated protein Csm3 (group 7 of RAMP superfamily)